MPSECADEKTVFFCPHYNHSLSRRPQRSFPELKRTCASGVSYFTFCAADSGRHILIHVGNTLR